MCSGSNVRPFIALVLTAMTLTSVAQEQGVSEFNADVGYENGNFIPRGILPFRWSENFTSHVSYSGNQSLEIGYINAAEDSLNAAVMKEARLALGLLTYEYSGNKSSYSIGIEYEQINIDAEEKGFYKAGDGSLQMAELRRDIKVNRVNVPVSFQHEGSAVTNRISVTGSFGSELELTQDAYLPEYNSSRVSGAGKEKQDASWQLSWEGVYKFSNYFSPGWRFAYENLPLSYDTLLASSASPTGYETSAVQQDYEKMTAELRIYWGDFNESVAAARYIGFRREKITSTLEISGVKSEADEYVNSVVFGLDARF
ncbi:hypothetical protein GJQ54_04765 [Oceanospirillaceae bacterium ASx5O]|nr:hypothetical protein GJQ54_04765 [Oceanospirillaceae bacterium ASx5O]